MKRQYRKITARTVAQHTAQAVIDGNNTAAVITLEGERGSDSANYNRAYKIAKKRDDVSIGQYIDDSLEQIGEDAIQRVGELVNSRDERIATKNSHFIIEHIRGKAVQRNISVTAKLNIQSVLD